MSLIERAKSIMESLNIRELKENGIFRTPLYYRIRVTYPPLITLKPRARGEEIYRGELSGVVYIHYPFCPNKCGYCHFDTYRNPRGYLEALKKNIGMVDVVPDSIHIGGGTPTFMGAKRLDEFLKFLGQHYHFVFNREITIESRPDTLTDAVLSVLPPSYRLNIGVQDFNDHVLRTIGRKPKSRDTLKAIEHARKAGIENINIDLIYGLPNQTLEDWERDLDIVTKLKIPSITTYHLNIKDGTTMHQFYYNHKDKFPGEENNLLMHIMSLEKFKEAGYIQDPIDWFIIDEKYRYRHQQDKWEQNKNLIAFGPDVYWFINGYEGQNLSLGRYMSAINAGILPILKAEKLSQEEEIARRIGFGLKTRAGIDISEFLDLDLPYIQKILIPNLQKLKGLGLINDNKGVVTLTYTGQLYADEIFTLFFTQETNYRSTTIMCELINQGQRSEYFY